MSTEETDIRIDAENMDATEQSAEADSFGVTAYIDMEDADAAGQKDVDMQHTKTIVTDSDADEENSDPDGQETEQAGDESGGQSASDTVYVDKNQTGSADDDSDGEASEGENEGGTAEEEGEDTESQEPEKDPEIEAIKEKIRERKREKRRKARMRRTRFWTLLSATLISIALLIFSLSSFFTVDSIEVRGNSRFTAEEIINIAHAVPGHNIIYNPGSAEIVEYLEQNPFIKSASVSRKLPSTLVITVNERKQACAFKYDDDYLVMDDEGILLNKTRTEPKITMIYGLVASKIKLGETIGTKNQQMFSKTLKLIREMNAGDLYFVSIDMTEYEESRMVRAAVYDKLVVKSDYDLLVENIGNGRLHKVLEKLFDDGVKRGTITLNADGTAGFEPGL